MQRVGCRGSGTCSERVRIAGNKVLVAIIVALVVALVVALEN